MGLQNSSGAALVDDSFDDLKVLTKSDTIDEAHRLKDVRAIRSTAGGAVTVITQAAAAAAFAAGAPPTSSNGVAVTLVAGETLRLRVAYLLSTGTSAADVEALY
jgi:hypothetical protein